MDLKYVLIITMFIIGITLSSCSSNNNETEKATIENRDREIASSLERKNEMKALEDEINQLNSRINTQITSKGVVTDSPSLNAMADANIASLKSRKDMLEKKLIVLYEIDKNPRR